METLLNRYRSLTLLLLVLLAQLVLVAYQVKTKQDIRLLRVWTVSAVTPLARLLESGRTGMVRFVEDYLLVAGVRQENRRLMSDVDRLRMENRALREELARADRAEALRLFQSRIRSTTLAARVIGTGAGAHSGLLFVDRGSNAGVRPGMAVINPDGLVGRVRAVYPTASQVSLITDPGFAAGVISGKHRVQGTLAGAGRSQCAVRYIQNDEPVEVGEWFYTSGEDRIFPRGIPVGQVKSTAAGKTFREIVLTPSSLGRGIEEVLVVTAGVHEEIPTTEVSAPLLPPPEGEETAAPQAGPPGRAPSLETDADRLLDGYRKTGQAFGDNENLRPQQMAPARAAPSPSQPTGNAPPAARPAPVKR